MSDGCKRHAFATKNNNTIVWFVNIPYLYGLSKLNFFCFWKCKNWEDKEQLDVLLRLMGSVGQGSHSTDYPDQKPEKGTEMELLKTFNIEYICLSPSQNKML